MQTSRMTLRQIPLNRRNVAGNMAALFSNSALTQGMTALAVLLTARQLGATVFGQYAACFALTGILSIGFNLGLDTWLLREGGRFHEELSELTGSVLAIKVFAGVAWLALILLGSLWLNQDTFPAGLLILSALTVWADGLLTTALTAFKASLHNKYTLLIESTTDLVWLLATLLLVLSGSRQAAAYIQVRGGALALGMLVAVFLVSRLVGIRATPSTVRRSLQGTIPFATSDFLAYASMRLDVTIVAFTIGKYSVGLYSPAVSLTNALFLIPTAIYLVMVPVLSKLFTTNPQQAWQTARRFILVLILVGIASFAALALGASFLVSILGKSYAGSAQILQILSIILLFKSISYAMAAILVAGGQQAQRTVVQAVAVVSNALLNLLIVYRFGIQGVAVVYVITEIMILIGYSWLARRYRLQYTARLS